MMISPEGFIKEYEDKSYAELLTVRDELLEEIFAFEKHEYNPRMDFICPSPDTIYSCNLNYLGKLCELISEKFSYSDDDDEEE